MNTATGIRTLDLHLKALVRCHRSKTKTLYVWASLRLHRLHIYDLTAAASLECTGPQDKERVFTDEAVGPDTSDPKTPKVSMKVTKLLNC